MGSLGTPFTTGIEVQVVLWTEPQTCEICTKSGKLVSELNGTELLDIWLASGNWRIG